MKPDQLEDLKVWLRFAAAHARVKPQPDYDIRARRTYFRQPWLHSPELDRFLDSIEFERFEVAKPQGKVYLSPLAAFVGRYYVAGTRSLWPRLLAEVLWGRVRHDLPEESVDILLRFLELDPMAFRTGYAKTTAIRLISRSQLNQAQLEKVEAIVRDLVLGGFAKQLSGWRLLVRRLPKEVVYGLVAESLATKQTEVIHRGIDLFFAIEPQLIDQAGANFAAIRSRRPRLYEMDWPAVIKFIRGRLSTCELGHPEERR